MSATIITSPGKLAVPNGIKVKTDVADYPQTLLIQDMSKIRCYPSRANPVPNGTEFVNLATSGTLTSEGFVAEKSLIGFSGAFKSLTFQGLALAGADSDRLRFGSSAAPYPLLGIGGQNTDLLVIIWAKLSSVSQQGTLLTHASTAGVAGNANKNFHFQYGFVAGQMNIYLGGVEVSVATAVPFEYDKWVQFAGSIRCANYNGKAGQMKSYKNGAVIATRNAGVPAAMLATDNTIPIEIGDGFNGEFGRLVIIKGLDVAGLNPDTIVAQDYAAGVGNWPTA